MSYDNCLNNILNKYNLLKLQNGPYFESELLFNQLYLIPPENKVVIWGAGEHTKRIWDNIPGNVNIVGIIDKNATMHGTLFNGVSIYSPEFLIINQINTIIVSSYFYRHEIIRECNEKYPFCKVINFYEKLDHFFPLGIPIEYTKSTKLLHLIDSFIISKYYEIANKNEDKERFLLTLIKIFLDIRDFKNSLKWIEVYIQQGFEQKYKITLFRNELLDLLLNFRKELKIREKSDVIFMMIDSMRINELIEGDTPEPKFISSLINKGIFFSKAFSTSSYTKASLISIFTGKMLLDDNKYNDKIIDSKDSDLFLYFVNNDYQIYQISGLPIIEGEEILKGWKTSSDSFEQQIYFPPITMQLWQFLCNLLENRNDATCSLLSFIEVHYPFLCPIHKDTPNLYSFHYYLNHDKRFMEDAFQQYLDCLNYVDEQLEFYFNYFPDNLTSIIFSDHGSMLGEYSAIGHLYTWYDEVMHVPLIVYNNKVEPMKYNHLFSLKDFSKQIIHILKEMRVEIINTPEVHFQRDPIYNKDIIDNQTLLKNIGEKYFKGYKVIRSEYDKYILYDNNLEEYYILPNEELNLISDEKYKVRIEEIRNIINKDFPYLKC